MFDFVFDLPLTVSGAAVILILCIYGVGGQWYQIETRFFDFF